MPPSGEYSLYFHVPFCTRKCDYCHFYVIPDDRRFHKLYMQALELEWKLCRSLLPSTSPVSIYFGGGTPSLLGADQIGQILSWIAPSSNCEISLEANPENVSLNLMRAYASCGINRVSLGVQSFDPQLLQTLSRTHTASKAEEAIEQVVQAGISNLSIDLMYDLPGQSEESWETSVKKAVSLPISHLSLYNLTIEPHTVFFKKRSKLTLPSPEMSLSMLTFALEAFEAAGFHRYEISAFSRPSPSIHNTGYWKGRPFLGLGPSAYSYWDGSRMRNSANLNRYAQALFEGKRPIDFEETLCPKEQTKERIAIGLRLIEGIDASLWLPDWHQELQELEHLGFIEKSGNKLRLTPHGLLFHDTVAERVMAF